MAQAPSKVKDAAQGVNGDGESEGGERLTANSFKNAAGSLVNQHLGQRPGGGGRDEEERPIANLRETQ